MFSIVIPTIGRTSLDELLSSIPASPMLASVIVVGDARMSKDRANSIVTHLRSWTKFEIKWLRPEMAGVNVARNMGIREAASDSRNRILIFLDDDVVLPRSFSWEAVCELYNDPSVLAVGGNYLSSSDLEFSARGYNLMCSAWRVTSGYEENEALLGGAWSVRLAELINVCRDLGWFEEDIQYGGAETPFIHRLRTWASNNWRILHSQRLDVFHRPRNRRMEDWLKIASLQRLRLDGVTKASRPALVVRFRRLLKFSFSLSISDLLVFLAFTLPFVAAGRIALLTNTEQKSK